MLGLRQAVVRTITKRGGPVAAVQYPCYGSRTLHAPAIAWRNECLLPEVVGSVQEDEKPFHLNTTDLPNSSHYYSSIHMTIINAIAASSNTSVAPPSTPSSLAGWVTQQFADMVEAGASTAIWMVSTLKRRRRMMNKHKLRKRRKKNRKKTKKQ